MRKILIYIIIHAIVFLNLTTASVVTIGNEYGGNSSTSRNTLDDEMNNWKLGSSGLVFYDIGFGSGTTVTTGSKITINYNNTETLDISLVDMIDLSPNSTGVLSTDNINLQGSLTLQDGSPKPQSRYTISAPFVRSWNDLNGGSNSKNGILFNFSNAILGFAGWFGDLETRTIGGGTPAEYRLFDSSGLYISGGIINTTTLDQSLCGDPVNSNYVGCGNRTTRIIGVKNDSINLIKSILIIVGDDDINAGNDNGFLENISFMGGVVTPLTNYCGDGIIQSLNFQNQIEICDDGNNSNNDGCSSICQIENICVANSGSVCQTTSNACGIYNTGVTLCDGSCSNTIIPDTISGYNDTCSIGIGACLSTGNIICNGSCSAIIITGSNEICNNIDDDCDGQIDEGSICDTGTGSTGSTCVLGSGNSCQITGSSNSCGMYNTSIGIISCLGFCDAIIPSIPSDSICITNNTGNNSGINQIYNNNGGTYNKISLTEGPATIIDNSNSDKQQIQAQYTIIYDINNINEFLLQKSAPTEKSPKLNSLPNTGVNI